LPSDALIGPSTIGARIAKGTRHLADVTLIREYLPPTHTLARSG
jgi:hypothetical protein